MRSELNEVARIDQYLFGELSEEEANCFEAQRLVNDELADKVAAQRLAHRLIQLYSRKKERDSIEAIYQQLVEEPSFARQLKTIFI